MLGGSDSWLTAQRGRNYSGGLVGLPRFSHAPKQDTTRACIREGSSEIYRKLVARCPARNSATLKSWRLKVRAGAADCSGWLTQCLTGGRQAAGASWLVCALTSPPTKKIGICHWPVLGTEKKGYLRHPDEPSAARGAQIAWALFLGCLLHVRQAFQAQRVQLAGDARGPTMQLANR